MSDDLSRRQVLVLAAGACACCAAGAEVLADAPAGTKLTIGRLADYPDQKFYDQFSRSHKVMVRRLDDRLVVMTAICTHKRCTLKIKDDAELRCPCHKSFFTSVGTPTGGPAKLPLVRYAVSAAPDGTIEADLSQSFDQENWDDPKSFIALTQPADPS